MTERDDDDSELVECDGCDEYFPEEEMEHGPGDFCYCPPCLKDAQDEGVARADLQADFNASR